MKRNLVDIIVLLILMGIGSFYAYITRDYFIGKALFVGMFFTIPPTIYLGVRKKKNWKKIIFAVFLFGIIFGFALDFIAEYTFSWKVISTIFDNRILGINTIDSVLGISLMTLLTVTFYEHFFEKRINSRISKRYYFAIIPSLLGVIFLLLLYFLFPNLLETKYPYFYIGIIAILPVFYLVLKNPKIIGKILQTSVYFFVLYFVIEIFAVKYDYWIYPGNNYIGSVSIFNISFPFEELFFWMMFYSMAIVSYYEILIDDEK